MNKFKQEGKMTVALQNKQELTKQNPMQEIGQFMEMAGVLATCPYYQKLGKGGILAIILTAKEMGLPPMACLNGGMYTFSGAVSLSAQLMNMMIVNAGHMVEVVKLDNKECTLRFTRKDRPKDRNSFTYSFTIDMAKEANLTGKTNWKTNPRDMLFNRCLSGGARKFLPDAIMNAYVIGELPDDESIIDTLPVAFEQHASEPVKPLEIEKVSEEQAHELQILNDHCSKEVQEKMSRRLESKKIESFKEYPLECYEATRKWLKEKADEHQEYLLSQLGVETVEEGRED